MTETTTLTSALSSSSMSISMQLSKSNIDQVDKNSNENDLREIGETSKISKLSIFKSTLIGNCLIPNNYDNNNNTNPNNSNSNNNTNNGAGNTNGTWFVLLTIIIQWRSRRRRRWPKHEFQRQLIYSACPTLEHFWNYIWETYVSQLTYWHFILALHRFFAFLYKHQIFIRQYLFQSQILSCIKMIQPQPKTKHTSITYIHPNNPNKSNQIPTLSVFEHAVEIKTVWIFMSDVIGCSGCFGENGWSRCDSFFYYKRRLYHFAYELWRLGRNYPR